MAGRNSVEAEGLIGLFVNTLVLRTDLSGDPSFRELLGRVRQGALGAYGHQDVPFERLVEELRPERSFSYTPFFQVMFVLQNTPAKVSGLPGLKIEDFEFESGTAKFDLTLEMFEKAEWLTCSLEYRTDLFEVATITRMLGHFRNLLEGIVTDPDQRLSDLPLLTELELHQLLVEWNDTTTEYPQDQCIHQLFEDQAERTPEAAAVTWEGGQLTYGRLNFQANQLAHFLRKRGVGPDVRVGICMERPLEIVIGLLGILKAGGAYVPLDPTYPGEQLAFLLEDAQVPVLLTQRGLLEGLPEPGAEVVCLDADREAIAQQSGANLVCRVKAESLAYVIYTSGSTGKPKGVAVPHRAVNRLVCNTDYVKLDQSDRVAQAASCSFDAATFEVWGALLHGARLVGITKDVVLSPRDLAATIRQQGITALFLTTALFNQLARELPSAFNSVRHLLFGGEAVDPQWVKEVLQHSPPERLLHVYGPTEGTTFTSWHLAQGVPERAAAIPIGKPVANTKVYLLDRHLQPVPVGVPGELYVGGDGLARGYLGRPGLTAEKFIPNPFSREPGARLYKSGDLARYLPDGKIEFLGRADDQVKVRGFRVEPGEVEAMLDQHPAVRQSVVLAREDVPGGKRLVAYVVPNQQQTPTLSNLRSFLKQKLPDYMVPSAFVLLDALPLTPNGKLDRAALPVPDQARPGQGPFVAPRTPTEEVLAGIWAEVLGLEQLGIHDDFFELGGHSLLATQVISRLRASFLVELPLRCLFETPTVAGLARSVEQANRAAQGLEDPPLQPVSRDGELPLSFAQQRLWFLDQLEPARSVYNVPAVVRMTGKLNVAALVESLDEIVRRHEALRTHIVAAGGRLVQVVAPAKALTLRVVDLQGLPAAEREEQAMQLARGEAQRPYDLSRDLMLRGTLLCLDDEEHALLLTVHHIAFDGWSLGLFFRELAALYDAFCAGKASPLPELPLQYADFAHWQREWLQGEVLEKQLSYWQQQLEGDLPVLRLPADHPRPALPTFRGGRQSLVLSRSLSESLDGLSRREGVTLFMTLLAAFQTLLHRYTGQDDIAVGSPIAGRNHAEIEGLIGFFVNTLVLRTDLSGDPPFRELLGRVREVALGAYAHQDLPFERLVEELHPGRDLSRTPLFQVMFALQNAPMKALELSGLTLCPLEIDSGTAKFDLTLSMTQEAQGLKGRLEYNTDLFETDTITRMLGHFQSLLEGVAADPDQPLSGLPLLTEPERHQLLVEWNDTAPDYPQDECIHQLFEARAEQTPEAIAVIFEGQQLTYGELNRRANKLAHYLKRLGVKPDALVGICLERSVEMPVGLLGILKAGGAYVPLDPAYPKERLASMLADAKVPVLLTQQPLVAKLAWHKAKVICLDSGWEMMAQESTENPIREATPDNLAYVIFTSGSTARPKGVAMGHRALCNLLAWQLQSSASHEPAKTLQFTSLSFDVSFQEIFSTWCSGGTLVLISEKVRREAGAFLPYLTAESVERLFVPFVGLQHLAEAADCGVPVPTSLRETITAGEQLQVTQRIASLFSKLGRCTLQNQYGPTESHVVTAFTLTGSPTGWPSLPPIGRPIANTQIYLLDCYMQPVPIGVPGELYVGGVGLARGYLGQPGLTAERFIPNPSAKRRVLACTRRGTWPAICRTGILNSWAASTSR
jgi:amino acid adenylation domain-containing protein